MHWFLKARVCIAVFAMLVLSSCATAPGSQFTQLVDTTPDAGDVYLLRMSALFAVGIPFKVYVNGKAVGELTNASYFPMRLRPGAYTLTVDPGGIGRASHLSLDVKAGSQNFYEYEFVTGPLANTLFIGSSIEPRSRSEALQSLKDLRAAVTE